jgi:hypothetical protein
MTMWERQRQVQLYRGADAFSGPAEGGLARGPGAVLGGYQMGASSEDAGCEAGVSPAVGTRALPVAASQIRAVRSSLAVASHLPSGAIATASTPPAWPVRTARSSPVAASQIRAVPSRLAVASQEPSGATATAVVGPARSARRALYLPVTASQIRVVRSWLAVASQEPSGATATALTTS